MCVHISLLQDIDFGHFLGNFKYKKLFNITFKRERSPFVFLPSMKYCIKYNFTQAINHYLMKSSKRNDNDNIKKDDNNSNNGNDITISNNYKNNNINITTEENDLSENYDQFVDWCKVAYQAVRSRQRLFINLFRLMIPSQMPELLFENDIKYMRKMMRLDIKQDDEVKEHIAAQLKQSLNDKLKILDNIIHSMVHSKH